MTKETLLMQYQSECLSALKSVANIHKPFEKAFMDTMKLFMAIPDRINFLQLGRYGCFSEQTYRNLFEHETFDWFAFNGSIISKHLTGKRKAYSISSCKSFIHNAYMLERFICVFGISPDPQVIDKLFKELILFTARAA